MKPPAFQFYAADFYDSAAILDPHETGTLIRLMCQQWTRGGLPDNRELLERLAGGKISETVLGKFPLCADGLRRNGRLEYERQKQARYRAKQQQNGIASGIARRQRTTVEPPPNGGSALVGVSLEPKGNSSSLSSSPCIAERGQAPVEYPDWPAVKSEADRIGLAEWKAKDWFDEMEGCGWLDHQQRPVLRWQSVILRVCRKWEADGRPFGPPSRQTKSSSTASSNVEKIIHDRELRRIEARLKEIGPPGGLLPAAAEERKALLGERAETRRKLNLADVDFKKRDDRKLMDRGIKENIPVPTL